jgi:hypothetical protein
VPDLLSVFVLEAELMHQTSCCGSTRGTSSHSESQLMKYVKIIRAQGSFNTKSEMQLAVNTAQSMSKNLVRVVWPGVFVWSVVDSTRYATATVTATVMPNWKRLHPRM